MQYLKKISPALQSVLKRAQRKLINIQPTAVQRRKNKNGSKKKVKCGGKSTISSGSIPAPRASRKRPHDLNKNIVSNVMSAKKHCRDMKSKNRPVFKKNENDQNNDAQK